MRTMSVIRIALIGLAAGLVSGCAGTRQLVPRPNPTQITNTVAHVEVHRPFALGFAAHALTITDNDRPIGELGVDGVLSWERAAGPMRLAAKVKAMGGGEMIPIEENVQGGMRYSYRAGFPFWYPFSRDGLARVSQEPLLPSREPVVAAPAPVTGPILRRWALVIGISSYRDKRVPRLQYASADAKAFYRWLVDKNGGGYSPANVRILCDEQATGTRIRGALFTWLKSPVAEDMVTIYFAGHGSAVSPDTPDNLFLLPHDVDYGDLAATGIPLWDLESSLRRFVRARRVVIIADACRAVGVGAAFDSARGAGRELKTNAIGNGLSRLAAAGNSVHVLTSADASQHSQEGDQWGGGHGVFTHFMLQGLGGQADGNKDGRVSVGELATYLSEQVRHATESAQCPRVYGVLDPELTLGK